MEHSMDNIFILWIEHMKIFYDRLVSMELGMNSIFILWIK
jgi:hypothetical protein